MASRRRVSSGGATAAAPSIQPSFISSRRDKPGERAVVDGHGAGIIGTRAADGGVKSSDGTANLSATRLPSNAVYIVDSMTTPAYLGEFEQLLLLAVLRLGADAYGADIARELEERAGRSVSRGALYTSLDRLEDKGLRAVEGGRRHAGAQRPAAPRSMP